MLDFDEAIRSAVRSTDRSDQIRMLARQSGMKLMQEYALEPVRKGPTTLDEILRVVPFEQIRTTRCLACGYELPPTFAFCPWCGEKKIDQLSPMKHRHSLVDRGATGE